VPSAIVGQSAISDDAVNGNQLDLQLLLSWDGI
jgi:hypothetical protein